MTLVGGEGGNLPLHLCVFYNEIGYLTSISNLYKAQETLQIDQHILLCQTGKYCKQLCMIYFFC